MKIIALYVYTPTTITTDTSIEQLGEKVDPLKPGQLVLKPGLYRVRADAQLDIGAGKYQQVVLGDDKDQWPDPPGAAMKELNLNAEQIKFLLGGTGKVTVS